MTPSGDPHPPPRSPVALEAVLALTWFGLHSILQLVNPESEVAHWGSLVAVPLLGLVWLRRRLGGRRAVRAALRSVGLDREWRRGLGWAIPLGFALSALQLLLSRNGEAFLDLVTSGRALWLFPIALLFLLLTAGFTEEFFFRGVVQSRLTRWTGSTWIGIGLASLVFALYHFPYAWAHPAWPTHGDVRGALTASLVEGSLAGVILGSVFSGSRRNLVAAVVVHALIDVFPAMTMIRFGGA